MRIFPHPNTTNDWRCKWCGTSDDEPVVLVPVPGTENGNIVKAEQIHATCYIEYLETFIPKTVKPTWGEDDLGEGYSCPCGFVVFQSQHYCENCGSKFDWSDV
jgi:hypothetical protein